MPEVKTVWVRFYAEGGHVGLLNASDFDQARHEEVSGPDGATVASVLLEAEPGVTIPDGDGALVETVEPEATAKPKRKR